MATRTPATCGRPWQPSSPAITPWSCPTCAAWASRHAPREATRRSRRPRT
jgi:hypothetical protein